MSNRNFLIRFALFALVLLSLVFLNFRCGHNQLDPSYDPDDLLKVWEGRPKVNLPLCISNYPERGMTDEQFKEYVSKYIESFKDKVVRIRYDYRVWLDGSKTISRAWVYLKGEKE